MAFPYQQWAKTIFEFLMMKTDGDYNRDYHSLEAIGTRTSLLSGESVDDTLTNLDLNGGTASSGLPGQDLYGIWVDPGGRIEIMCMIFSMKNCTTGANITIRALMEIDGVFEIFKTIVVVKDTDPDGILVFEGNIGAGTPIYFEMYSDNGADDGIDVPYTAVWRVLEIGTP